MIDDPQDYNPQYIGYYDPQTNHQPTGVLNKLLRWGISNQKSHLGSDESSHFMRSILILKIS